VDSYAETWDMLCEQASSLCCWCNGFAAPMAAFVTDGCRGFSGAGPLFGHPHMKSVTLIAISTATEKVTTPLADVGWIYNLLNS
jgi:hypothetical protein